MTVRAIYVAERDTAGRTSVLLLGDHQATPVRLEGASVSDALGKRPVQYDELIAVELAVLNDEVTRRIDLCLQMAWQGGDDDDDVTAW